MSNCWRVKGISTSLSGISGTLSHKQGLHVGRAGSISQYHCNHILIVPYPAICIASPSTLLGQCEEGGRQRKWGLQRVDQKATLLTFTLKMSENTAEWLTLNKHLSSTSTYPIHGGNQDSRRPLFTVCQNPRFNAHHCHKGHQPQRSNLLWSRTTLPTKIWSPPWLSKIWKGL